MARASVMPAVAPTACAMRATMSPSIVAARQAAALAAMKITSAQSSTGRRPNLSASGPSTSCDTAIPARNRESVS